MNLTLSHRAIGGLIFNDDESLSQERSIYVRSPFFNLDQCFPRRIIPFAVAAALELSNVFHIQIIETTPKIFVLWRREDWEESVTKRYALTLKMSEVKLELNKEKDRRSRVYRIAVKLNKFSGASVDLLSSQLTEFLAGGEDAFREKILTIEKLLNKKGLYEPPSQEEANSAVQEVEPRLEENQQTTGSSPVETGGAQE